MELQRDQLRPLVVSDSPVEKFREFLEIRGEKLTERRRLLVEHIFNTHKHFDADELVRDLHEAGHRVSRATVYRTLRLLVEAGLLRELRLTNRSASSTTTAIRPTTTCIAPRATGSWSSATTRSSGCATRSAWPTGSVPAGIVS